MPVPKGTRIGGRQKGTPNKLTQARRDREEEAMRVALGDVAPEELAAMSPVELLMRIARAAFFMRNLALAVTAAKEAAPYLAAKVGTAPPIDDGAPTADEIAADGDPEVKE